MITQRFGVKTETFFSRGISFSNVICDRCRLGLRGCDIDTRLQSRNSPVKSRCTIFKMVAEQLRRNTKRNPRVDIWSIRFDNVTKIGPHYTDNGERRFVDMNLLTNDCGIAAECVLPGIVTDDDDLL